MKKFYTILLCLFTSFVLAQLPKETSDYLSVGFPKTDSVVHYIFKSGRTFFAHNRFDGTSMREYSIQDSMAIQLLFRMAEKMKWKHFKTIDENAARVSSEIAHYKIITYKKKEKIYRVCFNMEAKDKNSLQTHRARV